MIKVKITHPYGNWPLARQTPNNSGIWGDCQFFINDDTQECDYWFVFDDLLKEESVICNPKNTVIITLEFPAIRPNINLRFLKQFSTVFTYSRQIKHPRIIEVIAPFPWHIGVNNTNSFTISSDYKIYDDFNNRKTMIKPKLMSVISSSKRYTEGHRQRLKFVDALKEYFGESIDVFGRGINNFADKWDTICPYKYHISLENSACRNGISEKLYDSFLGGAFPFYYGCPNVNDYFPTQSFIAIDINDIDQSLKIIDKSISLQVYEKSIEGILSSKMLVLDKYNVFELISKYCKNDISSQKNGYSKSLCRFYPEAYFNNSRLDKFKNHTKAIDFIKEHNFKHIDLIKINIEGGEYDLLEHLLDSGFIGNIHNIQVQFHDFVSNAESRMNKIQNELSKTHFLTYQYPFVWENWQIKNDFK